MEFEQIAKRLEWLDDQQRKNKEALSNLDDRLAALQSGVNALTQQAKTITKELSELGPVSARLDQFDQMMTKQRDDLNKTIKEVEKGAVRREAETAKLHQREFEVLNKSIAELRVSTSADELDLRIKERALAEQRLTLAVQDLRTQVEAALKNSEAVVGAQKSMEEARRRDAKRLADIQGELSAVRKRADDAREKTTLHADSIRNMENHVKEMSAAEAERKDAQAAFLEQQTLAQIERDRGWKEWQVKYETFKKQAETMDAQVAALDDSLRAAKRAQEAYTELNQKLERRIAEVSEMQRLAEDRVRQEWVAFKADEQKRWTSYSLSQEETARDLRADTDKLESRVTLLDDATQTLQDQLQQTAGTTEQQLQELMNVSQEWLTAYERIMGHSKPKARKAAK